MSLLDSVPLTPLVLLGFFLVYKIIQTLKVDPRPLPPGPKPVPLLGNALDLPKTQEWLTYARWGKQYGDVVHVSALGQPIFILNSREAAVDLLEKKSSIYSDRPYLAMGGDLVGWSNTLVLTPYNARFRNMRKYLHRLIGARNSNQFWALEEQETKRFLRKILDDSHSGRNETETGTVAERIRWTAGAIILLMSHGYTLAAHDDPFVKLADIATEQFSASTEPGAWLVDLMPSLKHIPTWFPLAGFRRTALKWRATLEEMAEKPYAMVKAQMAAGTAHPSFTRELLEDKGSSITAEENHTIKWAAASLYSGGADTTVSAIYTLFLAMTLNPRVQKCAQAELDSVLCGERLPSFQDRLDGKLPYVEALVKEILRWAPVTPTGVPHRLTEEDEYRGWRVPKGTIVISNIWGMTRDESIYPNANEFRPERFLTKAQGGDCETEADIQPDPRGIAFGFGRRVCPGQNLADLSLWISTAMTLSVYNIAPVSGAEPTFEYTNGTISHPKPFKCSIKPRSTRAEQLILAVGEDPAVAYLPSQKPVDIVSSDKGQESD
ncbi:cytochrome P450 [Sistotremastrum niveocremeum HHB9708]|uniref:Cytochrome P450 n=1 Tax=Sistotremastrum niveocremeum HHB9708 TaxID=1314777 RepID=A0A164PPM0_9AGAM|nr:cytochrome P450 [Sistotremastrum niveocremeum HHB9708]